MFGGVKRNIILKGYGRHFIINNFKKFYFEQTSKNFDENQNIEIQPFNKSKVNPKSNITCVNKSSGVLSSLIFDR